MIHLDDMKAFVHFERNRMADTLLPILTTLISGIVIIISISPYYLHELNPFTLFLLAVASALPVWALNQLLWWQLGRSVTGKLVARFIILFNVPEKDKKLLSFALTQLMKSLDVMRFIPSKNIANLVTIFTIYIAAAADYFYYHSPAFLYGVVFFLSILAWLCAWLVLHRTCQKIKVETLKKTWEQLKNDEEFFAKIDGYFERIEKLLQSQTGNLW